ncbi:hypothetical protein [Lacticaseibacillus sharpeae]|uniref:Uncharacterized protein n=1 Tax=Lacticaseibacillus sharpeae JCM 1186 = DSM 20505 TaxID=1291052 RepID=A0A0R1ZRC3_9LACO|nr:hypothetical protein [Lacticaseibacillus sharpeae]KRM54198.1 hypothetical protein FC18_GL000416 [Lacticaseibacillus sharpeae JCM 1186 = DSM 20505]
MRIRTFQTAISIFNAATLVIVFLIALLTPLMWLSVLLLVLYIGVMYYVTREEKLINAALDAMWVAADEKGLEPADLNALLHYDGKVPLARTRTGNRQYYLSKKLAAQFTKQIKNS